jgi:hypothetical protein
MKAQGVIDAVIESAEQGHWVSILMTIERGVSRL